jgi:(p)ppGpp synthase/HD superfamily hydrolase
LSEKSFTLTPRLYEALELTFDLFGKDARKSSPVPAMAHLLSVCALVQLDGGDEDEAIAALLHDTLEDKPQFITREEIQKQFGARVLQIIEVSTDTPQDYQGGPKPPWRDRKQSYLDHARTTDPALLRVTVADKVDNLRAILTDHQRIGGELWQRFNAGQTDQVWYYQEAVKAYEQAGFQTPLLTELTRLVTELSALSIDQI